MSSSSAGPSGPPGPPDASMVDPELRDESTLGMQLGIVSALHILALTITILRMYSRIFLAKLFGVDDGFMCGATLSAFVSFILYIYMSQHGLGMHKVFVSASDLWLFGAANFAQTIINLLGLALLKVSLSFSLLRLCRGRAFKWVLWGSIAFVTLYTIFAFLTLFLYCQPLSGFWDMTSGAKCYSIELFIRFGLANTAFSIFTDVLLATLPIPIIWQLQLKLKIRIYLIFMLALGWGAVGIGIVKAMNQINFNPFGDSTFEISIPTWAFIQLQVSIIAACAPQLKKLLRPLLGFTNSYKSTPYGDPSHTRRYRTGKSIGGRYMRQPSKHDKTDGFELDERPIISDGYHVRRGDDSGELGTHTMATSLPNDRITHRSNSSESMFADATKAGSLGSKGILMTTEVSVSST